MGGQIRWRRARRLLLRELSDHIADQAAAFEAEGRSPEEALAGRGGRDGGAGGGGPGAGPPSPPPEPLGAGDHCGGPLCRGRAAPALRRRAHGGRQGRLLLPAAGFGPAAGRRGFDRTLVFRLHPPSAAEMGSGGGAAPSLSGSYSLHSTSPLLLLSRLSACALFHSAPPRPLRRPCGLPAGQRAACRPALRGRRPGAPPLRLAGSQFRLLAGQRGQYAAGTPWRPWGWAGSGESGGGICWLPWGPL
ncbi:permease prefix domain 1-containing protein [Flavonifractor plautii]|nr:permease prefix domain 1-containing protein [Flavonifractor plautii]